MIGAETMGSISGPFRMPTVQVMDATVKIILGLDPWAVASRGGEVVAAMRDGAFYRRRRRLSVAVIWS